MLVHQKIDAKNRITYTNKPLIRSIYEGYYRDIKKYIYRNNKKKILELGSGGGNIKKKIKECIKSDPFKSENIDRI